MHALRGFLVLAGRLGGALGVNRAHERRVDDCRRHEDDEITRLHRRTLRPEENAYDRDIFEDRDTGFGDDFILRCQAADHRGLAVFDHDIGLGIARVDHNAARVKEER